jgi:hypothetical protein
MELRQAAGEEEIASRPPRRTAVRVAFLAREALV